MKIQTVLMQQKLLRENCKKCPMRRTSASQSLRDMENMEIVPIVVRHWMTIMLEEMDFVLIVLLIIEIPFNRVNYSK